MSFTRSVHSWNGDETDWASTWFGARRAARLGRDVWIDAGVVAAWPGQHSWTRDFQL